ncbi:MAG: hypothetical protein ACRDUV_18325 [Pseudonocardiaceae bacterium]
MMPPAGSFQADALGGALTLHRRELRGTDMTTTVYIVAGMHCEHCVAVTAVQEAGFSLTGVTA